MMAACLELLVKPTERRIHTLMMKVMDMVKAPVEVVTVVR